MMKRTLHLLSLFLIIQQAYAKSFEIKSPDERIKLTVNVDEVISWSAALNENVIIKNSKAGMDFSSGPDFGANPKVKDHSVKSFSSMIYPAILLGTGAISIIILLTFMVPKFTSVFAELGSSMPLSTRLLLGLSNAIRDQWWILLLSITAGWLIFKNYVKSDKGRYNWDSFKLRIMGDVIRKLETARFCRTLGTLLSSGVPMLQALNNAKDVINNQAMASAIGSLSKGVKEGKGITIPLSEANVFPPLAVSMVKVGEETGQLEDMLIKVAITYEKSMKIALKRFISFVEPGMILIMGLIIGIIVLSMLMAIFSISELPF